MKKVIEILMKRDHLSKSEATQILNDTMEEISIAVSNGDYELAEDIWYSDIGLEIDYLLLALL